LECSPKWKFPYSSFQLTSGRQYFGLESTNDSIFVAGGYNGTSFPNFEQFNFTTNSWTTLASLPRQTHGTQLTLWNGKFYLSGGTNGVSSIYPYLSVYDPNSNNWSSLANMTYAAAYHGATIFNGSLWIAGGFVSVASPSLSFVQRYNFTSNSWTNMSALNIGRHGHSLVVVGNSQMFVVGGCNFSGICYPQVEEYLSSNNSWILRTSMLIAKYYPGVVVIKQSIWVFGGALTNSYAANSGTTEIQRYDTISNTWSFFYLPIPNERNVGRVAMVMGKLFLIGGVVNNVQASAQIDELD
jgi:N-acetylneuraminic acid mutarotase